MEIGSILKIYKSKIPITTTKVEFSLEVKKEVDNPSINIDKRFDKEDR